MMEIVGVAEFVPEATLRDLYPEVETCRAIVRAVNRHERAGNINVQQGKTILMLGEPAVYSALSQLPKLQF